MGATYFTDMPGYMQAAHLNMLMGYDSTLQVSTNDTMHNIDIDTIGSAGTNPFNVMAIMYQAYLNGSPYSLAAAYDPSSEFAAMEDSLARFEGVVDDIDVSSAHWDELADVVIALGDSTFGVDSTHITNATSAFQTRTDAAYYRSISRVAAGFYEANAAEGTGMLLALALLENGRQAEVNNYQAELERVNETNRGQFISSQVGDLVRMDQAKWQLEQNLHTFKYDYQNRRIIEGKEMTAEEIDFAVRDAMWDLDLFRAGVQVMQASSGAPHLQQAPNTTLTALSAGVGILGAVAPIIMAAL